MRRTVALALGRLGAESGEPVLRFLCDDPEEQVRTAAVEAIGILLKSGRGSK
ncbi:MAG: HEAT repeat domain-containing protein [Lentisphaerae bacterium]|nr:HEAT repeat domain-containing protein [Lentisphaerota bacterium]